MLALTLLLLSATPVKTAAPAPASAAEVEKLRAEVVSLRERLEKLEKRFAADDEARETKAANEAQLRTTLDVVLKQLQMGDTKNVDGMLRDAEKLVDGERLKLITAARNSLAHSDVANARMALMLVQSTLN